MRTRTASFAFLLAGSLIVLAACATRARIASQPAEPRVAVTRAPPRPVVEQAAAEVHAPPPEPTPVTPQSATKAPCADDMAHVHGDYCTEVQQDCADWMEQPTAGGVGRCRRFAPSICKGKRVKMEFCIDKDEYTVPGESVPMGLTSWTQAKETCEKMERRLCLESEWNFACEGEEMFPYPIGLERDANKCNYDQLKLLDVWGKPVDHRKNSASLDKCVSPFGVRNMSGNVDEWAFRDVMYGKWRSALKGGWWMAARNRCRPATTAHDEVYRDFQTGFRCCANVKSDGKSEPKTEKRD